jgi:hypothetical protein
MGISMQSEKMMGSQDFWKYLLRRTPGKECTHGCRLKSKNRDIRSRTWDNGESGLNRMKQEEWKLRPRHAIVSVHKRFGASGAI